MAGVKGQVGGGAKKAPRILRLAKSPDGKRDTNWQMIEPEVPFRRYAPEKPDDLSLEAAKHWDEVTPELIRLNLLSQHHLGALIVLCETWARFKEALLDVQERGLTYSNFKGDIVRNPMVGVLEVAANQYRACCSEFGLTPSSESKLGPLRDESSGENPFAGKSAEGS